MKKLILALLVGVILVFSGCSKYRTPSNLSKKIEKAFSSDVIKKLKIHNSNYNEVEKEFIKDNLKNIGEITRKNLKYPNFSVKFREEGISVVQFILTPELLIENIEIIHSSGYERLDKNTIKTVKKSRKQYPRPKIKTRVVIYILYKLK